MGKEFEMENPVGGFRRKRARLGTLRAGTIGLIAGVCIGLPVKTWLDKAALANAPADEKVEQPAADETVQDNMPVLVDRREYVEAYAWTARIRLEGLGIKNTLNVTTSAEGKIIVSGNLIETHSGRYELFKNWYRAQKHYPELVDAVDIRKLTSRFPRVESVWLGANPVVHLETGEEARIGSRIGDGWTVTGINGVYMTLERNGTIIEVDHQGG